MKSINKFIKKYPFIIIMISLIILIPIMILIIKRPQRLMKFYINNPSAIEKIEITNGNNGDIKEIYDIDQITKITEFLNPIKVKKDILIGNKLGWSYKFKFIYKDNSDPFVIVMAGTNISLNDSKYTCSNVDVKSLLSELK